MKIKSILAILIFLVYSAAGQDFKEVKTAQDVVDNYLKAIGGEDAVREVKSIYTKGKVGDDGSGSVEAYMSRDIMYVNAVTPHVTYVQAIDLKNKTGWTQLTNTVTDMKPEDVEQAVKRAESTLWGNFLDAKDKGITYELMQNENINGNDVFVVEVKKDGTTTGTVYFDSKTFYKVKETRGNNTTEFSDFNKVGSSGVVMPHKIISAMSDVTATEIEFNTKFDKKRLKKPVEKVQ